MFVQETFVFLFPSRGGLCQRNHLTKPLRMYKKKTKKTLIFPVESISG